MPYHVWLVPVCRALFPAYDKPLVFYPLATLMCAGIRDILLIIPEGESEHFWALCEDGSRLGVHIEYREQESLKGIADALTLGEDFIGDEPVCLVLGDNIFYGPRMRQKLRNVADGLRDGATIFGYYVEDPRPYGVVEFDDNGKAISLEEKPRQPKPNYVVPGLYFYNNSVVDIVRKLEAEDLGSLAENGMEITAVNNAYLEKGLLSVVPMGDEYSWFDAGTEESLYYAAGEIRAAQRSGKIIACLEEIAFRNKWIGLEEVKGAAESLKGTAYGRYLEEVVGWREE